jgi:hypothetical protein
MTTRPFTVWWMAAIDVQIAPYEYPRSPKSLTLAFIYKIADKTS